MADITLNTRMDGFIMPDKILALSENSITIAKTFIDAKPWICLETIAQSASLHVKWRKAFGRHSFLMKVDRFYVKTEPPGNCINGKFILTGQLVAVSHSASAYIFKVADNESASIDGRVVIGEIDFNDSFNQSEIQTYNRTLFQCLTNG